MYCEKCKAETNTIIREISAPRSFPKREFICVECGELKQDEYIVKDLSGLRD